MSDIQPDPRTVLLDYKQLVARLNVSKSTIGRLEAKGLLKPVRLPGVGVRWTEASVLAFVAAGVDAPKRAPRNDLGGLGRKNLAAHRADRAAARRASDAAGGVA
jgi:predicted DNA-binding transcriptional regulator AlpA